MVKSIKLQESWSKGNHSARELATIFSVLFFGNNSWSVGLCAPPPQQKVFRHITAPDNLWLNKLCWLLACTLQNRDLGIGVQIEFTKRMMKKSIMASEKL